MNFVQVSQTEHNVADKKRMMKSKHDIMQR